MNREDQARRDLDRLEREREKLFHGSPPAANDDNDPYERLGRRIARIIWAIIIIAVIVYLFATYPS